MYDFKKKTQKDAYRQNLMAKLRRILLPQQDRTESELPKYIFYAMDNQNTRRYLKSHGPT